MIKKGSVLLLALLLSLPGCGTRKGAKSDRSKGGRRMAQNAEDLNSNLSVAAGDELEIDPSMRSFFDDMEEFVEFAENESELQLDEQDKFAWQDINDEEKQLEPVYFGFNKDKVDTIEKEKIAQNIDKTKQILASAGIDAKLVVEGHACSSAGSTAYNKLLSQKRAEEVASQLIAAGIPRESIKTVSHGNQMLVVKEGGRDEQWSNRRVEMHIIHI